MTSDPCASSAAAPYKAALFDWDGTVANTLEIWLRCYQWALHGWGANPSVEQISAQFGNWEGVFKLGVTPSTLEPFKQHLQSFIDRELPYAPLHDQAKPVIEEVRQAGVATAVVTTATWKILDPQLDRHELRPLFDTIVTADEVTHHKPHPEPVELALNQLGIQPHEAVMIGDSDKDLGAARAAGVDALLFYPTEHHQFYDRDYLTSFDPRQVCASWDQLAAVLLGQPTREHPAS